MARPDPKHWKTIKAKNEMNEFMKNTEDQCPACSKMNPVK